MDSVTSLAPSAASRYQGVARTANTGTDAAPRENLATANTPQRPASTTVTLSSRAQELAAQQEREERDDTRAASQTQQTASASDAEQAARRTQATDQADASAVRAQSEAQLRRAYSEPQSAADR